MHQKRPVFKKCPSCGSRKIKLISGDYRTKARGKPIVVHDIRRHECPNCEEVLLDYDAVKQIELRRFTTRKSRRFAHTG